MASFTFAPSMKLSLALLLLFLAAKTIATSPSRPSPAKCIHHHARLISCARFLKDDIDNVNVPQEKQSGPTEACCKNYEEIFVGGTPRCLCRYYLHPEKLKTSFNVTKLMSLHDLCPSSNTVPLYDLCVGVNDSEGKKFNGIVEVVNRDQVNLLPRHPSMDA